MKFLAKSVFISRKLSHQNYDMDQDKKYFVKISGFISLRRKNEFEKTFRYIFNQLPVQCLEHYISMDIFNGGYFHFYSLWDSQDALGAFLKSGHFHAIQDLCKTLGILEKTITGEMIDIKSFLVSSID
jgi:quinol monooxygenase YgiN